ncbi:MAG: TrkH family potassium uptake protein [Treponema sp.]|jgi:trk system potassium uptake protein TrkH|nr:TrkH family potassium uptake protein [Treponema sp.]
MKRGVIFRVLVFLLGIVALCMIPSLVLALFYGEGDMIRAFGFSMAAALVVFFPVPLFTRKRQVRFSTADGFLLVFLAWVFSCLLGAAPYYLSGHIPSVTGAVFESVSGFTTTGATVIADVEALPRSLLFWRAMTHWLGGMGIVVLTVALLPLLGAGGFQLNATQLFQAETPGPESDKIVPRITGTAKMLWACYLTLTVFQILLLAAGGMGWFDAAIHAFSTMATGGFSSRNASIAAYNSPWIDWVCTVFMFLAGLNFTLFFQLLRGKYRNILANSEARAYVGIILVSVIIVAAAILPQSPSPGTAIRQASFQTVSILTSTGLVTADHNLWPPLAQGVLFFLMFIGGCSGSTSGGVKVIRYVVLVKQAGNEMKKIIYPKGVFNIQLNGRSGKKEVVYGVAGFVFLYFVCLFAAALLVSSAGLDIFTSLNAALLCLGNIGLGLGTLGPFSEVSAFPAYVQWGLSFIMILGRLELWTVMVFFTRDYWRR